MSASLDQISDKVSGIEILVFFPPEGSLAASRGDIPSELIAAECCHVLYVGDKPVQYLDGPLAGKSLENCSQGLLHCFQLAKTFYDVVKKDPHAYRCTLPTTYQWDRMQPWARQRLVAA